MDGGGGMAHGMEGDPGAWQTIGTRPAFRNRWIGVEIDDVRLPDGRQYEYTRLLPAGIGVGVIGFNAAGEVLLEREYRHGVGEVVWQVPGGLAADGEELMAAGLRELAEEAGYAPAAVAPESVRYLGAVWDNPGMGLAVSHIFAAWELVAVGDTQRDSTEAITLHWQPVTWLKEAVRTGVIKDRVVVAALAFLMVNGYVS